MSVTCWNNQNYGGTTYRWPSNDPRIGSSMADQITSFKLDPWSKVIFYADSDYRGDRKEFNNDATTVMSVPNVGAYGFDTNTNRNCNDQFSSLQISAIPVPACAGAMSEYLRLNADVAAAGLNPWKHYAENGQREGRYWPGIRCDGGANACDSVALTYKSLYQDATGDAWSHFVTIGQAQNRAWPGVACDGRAVNQDSRPYADAQAFTQARIKSATYIASNVTYGKISVVVKIEATFVSYHYTLNIVGPNTLNTEHMYVAPNTAVDFTRDFAVLENASYSVNVWASTWGDVNEIFFVAKSLPILTMSTENDTSNVLTSTNLTRVSLSSTFTVATLGISIPATPLDYRWSVDIAGPTAINSGLLLGPGANTVNTISNFKIGNLNPAAAYQATLSFKTQNGNLTVFRVIPFTTLNPSVVNFAVVTGDTTVGVNFALPSTTTPNALSVAVNNRPLLPLTSLMTSLTIQTLLNTAYTIKLLEQSKSRLLSFTIKIANGNYLNIAEVAFLDATGNNIVNASTVDTTKTLMSSVYDPAYGVANVYDGRRDTICHSNTGDSAASLTVALKVPAYIYSVVIVNRLDCCQDRITGASISWMDQDGVSRALGVLPLFWTEFKLVIQ